MVLRGENMIITNDMVKNNLVNYSNKNNKISRDVKNGKLIKITRGLYETDPNTAGYLLASSIYGPSYLSFDFALYYYGLIPEKVLVYTNATYNKKKKKQYDTPFGTYLYRDVPKDVYPIGINLVEEGGYLYQIATPEKALCDKLYTLSSAKNMSGLENLLFNDLRIDIEELKKLNLQDIEELSKMYHSTNVKLLYKYVRRNKSE